MVLGAAAVLGDVAQHGQGPAGGGQRSIGLGAVIVQGHIDLLPVFQRGGVAGDVLAAVHPGGVLVGGEGQDGALIAGEGQLGGAALAVPGGDADGAVIQ